MYYSGAFLPEGRTNHGALLEPILNVTEELPNSEVAMLGDGYWLVIYANSAECADACKQALYTLAPIAQDAGQGDGAPEARLLARRILAGYSVSSR